MRRLLASLETEFGLAFLNETGERLPLSAVQPAFSRTLERTHATMPAMEGGWFLGNGCRMYFDSGEHLEHAAPECAGHPRELVAQVRAGRRLVARIAERLENTSGIGKVCVWIGNVDYLRRKTWGCHENHLTRHAVRWIGNDILPHLVSRVIYGGAGGWNLYDQTCFSLSPRLQTFETVRSHDTTSDRGLLNTRNEPHCSGYHRLHLICRDNLVSQFAELLQIGMTQLVVAAADRGLRPARGLKLEDDIDSLQTVCSDTTCRKRLKTSQGSMSAVDIQRRYLDALGKHEAELPPWAGEIMELTSGVLDQLEQDPRQLAGKLDWPTKLLLHEADPDRTVEERLLREMMFTSVTGAAMSKIDGGIVTDEEIDAAILRPPASTRAQVRGEVVRRFCGHIDASCSWDLIYTSTRKLLLDSPFQTREIWVPI